MYTASSIDFVEPLTLKVGRFLTERGYSAAMVFCRMECAPYVSDSYGILGPRPQPERYFFGLLKRKMRKPYLGELIFGEHTFSFKVCGRGRLDVVCQLASEISSAFKVEVRVILDSEYLLYEKVLADYDGL